MNDKQAKYPALKEIPQALKPWENRQQWLAFKIEPRKTDGKLTKVPKNPKTGYNASTTDSNTWGTYAQAVGAVKRFNLDGIGIVLAGDLFGIDLDHVITEDGEILPIATDVIQTVRSYTETSPSGHGYHILGLGALPPEGTFSHKTTYTDIKTDTIYEIEAYQGNTGRYFTITGNTINNENVNERTEQAAIICEKYLPAKTSKQVKQQENEDKIADILQKARNGKNTVRFTRLFDYGDLSDYSGDHSAADLALVNDLCYWTNGDADLTDQIFRRSALYASMKEEKGRKKWDVIHERGLTYGQATIEKALDNFKPYEELKVYQAAPGTQKPQERKPDKLEYYSAGDLENEELTPPEFVIPDILPPGLTIFAAAPKTGKSFFMLEAAAAIAKGETFWGKQTKGGSVLYLDVESNKYRVKKRLDSMGIKHPKRLYIAHRSEQLDTGLLTQIEGFIAEHSDTVAVIIDTLGRVKGSSRSRADAYTVDTQILAPLQTFALQKGIAVIAVTHLKKDTGYKPSLDPFEMITGSNAQFGVSDAGWLITGKRGESDKHFIVAGRDIEDEIDWTIERQKDGSWKLKGNTATLTLETRYNDYLFAPVTSTIRDLVPIAGSSWTGTAMELAEQIAQHTGQVLNPAGIGREIKAAEDLLLHYDNIQHIAPETSGRGGRKHTFRRISDL